LGGALSAGTHFPLQTRDALLVGRHTSRCNIARCRDALPPDADSSFSLGDTLPAADSHPAVEMHFSLGDTLPAGTQISRRKGRHRSHGDTSSDTGMDLAENRVTELTTPGSRLAHLLRSIFQSTAALRRSRVLAVLSCMDRHCLDDGMQIIPQVRVKAFCCAVESASFSALSPTTSHNSVPPLMRNGHASRCNRPCYPIRRFQAQRWGRHFPQHSSWPGFSCPLE